MSKHDKDTGNGWDLINWDVWKNPPKWIAAFVYSIGFLFLFFSAVVLFFIGDRILDTFVNYNIPKEVSYSRVLRDLLLSVAAIIGLPFLIWRTILTDRQTRAAEEKNRQEMQANLSLRLSKAIEQLGATKIVKNRKGTDTTKKATELRLGAIDELERIAYASADKHWQIMELLTAYIRENSPYIVKKIQKKITPDIQAALTVIGRRGLEGIEQEKQNKKRLKLSDCNLNSAILNSEANFSNAIFINSGFQKAKLMNVNFSNSSFVSCDFSNTYIDQCNLTDATIIIPTFGNTIFHKCNCSVLSISGELGSKCSFAESILLNSNINFRNDGNLYILGSLIDDKAQFAHHNSSMNHAVDPNYFSQLQINKLFGSIEHLKVLYINWPIFIKAILSLKP